MLRNKIKEVPALAANLFLREGAELSCHSSRGKALCEEQLVKGQWEETCLAAPWIPYVPVM